MILIYLVLSGIVISICIAWTYFLCYIIISLKRTPSLRQFAIRRDPYTENFETVESGLPKISIIIPAERRKIYWRVSWRFVKTNLSKFRNYCCWWWIIRSDCSITSALRYERCKNKNCNHWCWRTVGRERLGRVIKVISIQQVTFYSLLTRILLIPIVLFRCRFSIFYLTS